MPLLCAIFFDLPKPYHRRTWELVAKLVADLADAAAVKAA